MVGSFKRIPASKLAVSEPPPSWFGNAANEAGSSWTNANWLKSRFHFEFAEYSNPQNANFGVLRVLNDDLVQPKRGFGKHGHREVEICTYVVEGNLTHKDSMGTSRTIGRGAIQFMTAGTGVEHSEHNLAGAPLRFIQMWINTRQKGSKPNYGDYTSTPEQRKNTFAHLVGDVKTESKTPIAINADANIYVAEIDFAETTFQVQAGRQVYMLCMEGAVAIADAAGLERHDAAEIVGPFSLRVSATGGAAHVLLVEMAHDGSGRRDL